MGTMYTTNKEGYIVKVHTPSWAIFNPKEVVRDLAECFNEALKILREEEDAEIEIKQQDW